MKYRTNRQRAARAVDRSMGKVGKSGKPPISKERKGRKTIKARTFFSIKSARRYVSRFKWQFADIGNSYPAISATMAQAIRIKNGTESVLGVL